MAKAAKKKAAKAAPETKSIISAENREKMRNRVPDWLAKLITGVACPLVEKTVTERDGDGKKTKTVKVPGDVDVKLLFGLATENGIDVKPYKAQEGSQGFAGRMRMTIRNMLQGVAKQRHGLVVGGKFTKAPAEWLTAKKAPESPTHTKDGEKIAKKSEPKAEAKAPAKKKTAKAA